MAEAESIAGHEALPNKQTDWIHPQGILEIPKGVVACHLCGFTRFRRSKMRLADVKELVLMRMPVRCGRCNQRQFQSVLTSSLATGGSKRNEPRLARGKDTWKNWTEQEMADKTYRPMTTALGPRATKLRVPGQTQSKVQRQRPEWRDDDRQIW